jgi:AraC-like DNA-binding protein
MAADPQSFCPWIHIAGGNARNNAWISPARILTHWLLVWSDGGREVITVDGRPYDIGSGQSYLVQPGSLVELRSKHGNRPVWFHFDLAHDPRRAQHPQVHTFAPVLGPRRAWMQPRAPVLFGVDLPVLVPGELELEFRVKLKQILVYWQMGDQHSVRRAAQELGLLMLALVDHAAGGRTISLSLDQRLQRAEDALRAGLSAGAGLTTMASAAGLGRSRFCELYGRQRGLSPGAFIRATRLERSQELLTDSTLAIGEVATQVGFADATVFGRFFRQATGLTPRAWRGR